MNSSPVTKTLYFLKGCHMKVIAKVLIGILSFATSNSYAGPACSFTTEPIVKFIPQEYVFLGEVAGFVGPIKSNKILRDTTLTILNL